MGDANADTKSLLQTAFGAPFEPDLVDTKQYGGGQEPLFNNPNDELQLRYLESSIRRQKEASVNAKTSITFDQLKLIHELSSRLGPNKEKFYDRICRAAEIQRASLKNRLKQNREKFDSPQNSSTSSMSFPPSLDDQLSVGSILAPDFVQAATVMDTPPNSDAAGYTLMYGPSTPLNLDVLGVGNGKQTPTSFGTLANINELMLMKQAPRSSSPAETDALSLAPDGSNPLPTRQANHLLEAGVKFDEVRKLNELFRRFQVGRNVTGKPVKEILDDFLDESPGEACVAMRALQLIRLRQPITEVRQIVMEKRQVWAGRSNSNGNGSGRKRKQAQPLPFTEKQRREVEEEEAQDVLRTHSPSQASDAESITGDAEDSQMMVH